MIMTDFEPTAETVWRAWIDGQTWAQSESLPADCDVSVPAPGVVVLRYAQTGGFSFNFFGASFKERPADRPAPVAGATLVSRQERNERIERSGSAPAWHHEVEAVWATPLGRRWLAAMSVAAVAQRREDEARYLASREANEAAFAAAYAHLRAGGEPTPEILAGVHATGGVGRGFLRDVPADEANISALRAVAPDQHRSGNIDSKRAVALVVNGVPWVMSARGADLRYATLTPATAVQFCLPRRSAEGVRLDFTDADLSGAKIKYLSIAQMDITGAKVEGLTVSGCVMPWRLLRELRRLGVDISDCDTSDVPPVRYRRWRATSQRTLRHAVPVCGWSGLPEWHGPRACPRYAYIAQYARRTYARCMDIVNDQTAQAHVSRRALDAARAVAAADALLSGRYRGFGQRPSVERMEAAWAVVTRATGWIDHGGPSATPFAPSDPAEDDFWSSEARWRSRLAAAAVANA